MSRIAAARQAHVEANRSASCKACPSLTPPRDPVLAEAHAHWHDYGKSPRAGRKVGHATVCAPDSRQVAATLERLGRALRREAQVAPVVAALAQAVRRP